MTAVGSQLWRVAAHPNAVEPEPISTLQQGMAAAPLFIHSCATADHMEAIKPGFRWKCATRVRPGVVSHAPRMAGGEDLKETRANWIISGNQDTTFSLSHVK